jgi:hypothetical protein
MESGALKIEIPFSNIPAPKPKLLREIIPPGKGRISPDEYLNRVRRGQACGMRSMAHLAGTESGTVCIVGGGPSLQDTVGELRKMVKRGAKVFAVNKSHDWLLKRGFPCHYAALLDPKEWVAGYCDLDLAASKQTRRKVGRLYVPPKYLIASQCHDDTINKFKSRRDAYMWHALGGVGEAEILKAEFPNRSWCGVAGASVIGLRAVCIAHILGFRHIHLFGIDGSSKPPKAEGEKPQLYAYDKPHINGTWKAFDVRLTSGWSRVFLANHHMGRSTYEFEDSLKEWDRRIKAGRMDPFNITVHGDPEFSAIAMIAAGMGIHADPKENEKYGNPPPFNVSQAWALAQSYEDAGYRGRAIEQYESILDVRPNDLKALHKLSKLCPFTDSYRVLERYRMGVATAEPSQKLTLLSQIAVKKEAFERLRRNLPPYAISGGDLTFMFAGREVKDSEDLADALLQETPDHTEARMHKAFCARVRGDLLEAETCLRDLWGGSVLFNDGFYGELEGESLSGLPDVIDVKTQDFDGPVIYLACDMAYFTQFAKPLLGSIDAVAPGSNVHLHVMNAGDVQAFCATLSSTKIAISTETCPAEKTYYHAARFIRMYQYLVRYKQPLWLMDVDGLLNQDPRPLFDAEADVSLVGHAGRFEPWFQFNASVVGVNPTQNGIKYLRLVAGYISHFRDKLWWGIDQMALYGVYEHLKGTATFGMLPPNTLDGEYTDDGIVWTNGTAAKFSEIKTLNEDLGEPDSQRIRYIEALKKYDQPLGVAA